eukprot:scaffold29523_cov69-Phaeocystis_antarctica.AAC.3
MDTSRARASFSSCAHLPVGQPSLPVSSAAMIGTSRQPPSVVPSSFTTPAPGVEPGECLMQVS